MTELAQGKLVETLPIREIRTRRPLGQIVADILAHAYIVAGMLIFVLPYLVLVRQSVLERNEFTLSGYEYLFGSFGQHLLLSFMVTAVTIILNLVAALPAAYALVRFQFPGKATLLTLMTVSLYTPAVVLGFGLILVYNIILEPLRESVFGIVAAMTVGTFPLMLIPITVALKDLSKEYEEAALCLGASRVRAYFRVVLPLIGPGISAGILLTFVIVFNEYLVTLFVAAPGYYTAPRQVFDLIRWFGIKPSSAALAVTMQTVSFVVVLIFFRAFGSRYLRGTYLF
jgi:putative spermidine/putrescine transport system permease protein